MRCEDLTRELASPTGHLSQAEMAGHLAHCPSCAEWSRRAAHFDQIWEATRPSEPNEATLDALWASASVAIDAQLVPSTLRLEGPTHRRRSWMKAAFRVAQAAAILLAAVFLFRQVASEILGVGGRDKASGSGTVAPSGIRPGRSITTREGHGAEGRGSVETDHHQPVTAEAGDVAPFEDFT